MDLTILVPESSRTGLQGSSVSLLGSGVVKESLEGSWMSLSFRIDALASWDSNMNLAPKQA